MLLYLDESVQSHVSVEVVSSFLLACFHNPLFEKMEDRVMIDDGMMIQQTLLILPPFPPLCFPVVCYIV